MAFLPDEDESVFQVSLRGPQGTSLSATQSILDRMARDIREQLPGVKNTVVLAGGFGGGGGGSGNTGNITVTLKPLGERKQAQADLINRTRNITKKYSSKDYRVNVSASVLDRGQYRPWPRRLRRRLLHRRPRYGEAQRLCQPLVEKMKQDPIFQDPDTSIDVGTPEVRVRIDRDKAADLGVKAADVARALNVLAAGQTCQTFSEGSEQYDVVVQADEQYRRTRDNLKYFTVASSNGGAVGLEKLVKMDEGLSPASISRLNRQRQVTVSASLPPNSSESDALAKLEGYVAGARSSVRIFYGRHRPIQGTAARLPLVHARVSAVVRVYVPDPGGAVRIVYPPGDDPAHAAACRCLSRCFRRRSRARR